MLPLAAWTSADSIALNLGVLALAALAAMAAGGAIGFVFERLAVRPVYGQHLKQILVTMGGMIVAQEAIKVIWGGQDIALAVPAHLEGSFLLGGAAIEKYRLLAMALGLAVFVAMLLVLSRTRIGLLIRAGVESREMVEALGYRINRVFIGVFVVGAALAGLGGALWGLYQQNVSVTIGAQLNVLIFMVVIIGGLGSTTGCFIGALLIGLMENYTSFLFPQVAMFSDIALMMLILLWRPQGLYPVARR
jgi:branched-chain amino acid transport system permease protein